METKIVAAKCTKCEQLSYPTHYTCPACGATEFTEVPVAGEGTLLTFTRAYALALDYEQLYLTLGIADLEMGIRATGQVAIDEPRTGMRVRVELGPVRDIDGHVVKGLIFKEA
jgi:uncharacterized OB-fold protein